MNPLDYLNENNKELVENILNGLYKDNKEEALRMLSDAIKGFTKYHIDKALEEALEVVPYGGSDVVHYEDVVDILTCYPNSKFE